jgi:hypothetical protein
MINYCKKVFAEKIKPIKVKNAATKKDKEYLSPFLTLFLSLKTTSSSLSNSPYKYGYHLKGFHAGVKLPKVCISDHLLWFVL